MYTFICNTENDPVGLGIGRLEFFFNMYFVHDDGVFSTIFWWEGVPEFITVTTFLYS